MIIASGPAEKSHGGIFAFLYLAVSSLSPLSSCLPESERLTASGYSLRGVRGFVESKNLYVPRIRLTTVPTACFLEDTVKRERKKGKGEERDLTKRA